MRRRWVSGVLAASLAAGCSGLPVATHPARPTNGVISSPAALSLAASATPGAGPTARPTPAGSASPTARPSPSGKPGLPGATLAGIAIAPAALAPPGSTLISDHGTGIITDNGSGIITDNGSGIITDNGSGILANNGSSLHLLSSGGPRYHLQSLPQEALLAGVTVRLLDAAGQPVAGPDGQPLTAVTDAHGRFAFNAPLPPGNLVATATLPGNKGQVEAVVVHADNPRVVLSLVSTLTTRYILDQYVSTQTDRQACLNRLTASVEVDTRTKAGAALGSAQVALPDSLTPAKVVATVETIRHDDRTFDQQMETVRKLLILAGQSDQGNGQPALQVAFPSTDQLVFTPDGQLLMFSNMEQRIWRLTSDGRAVAIAGSGKFASPSDKADGQDATQTPLGPPVWPTFDAAGQLVFADTEGDAVNGNLQYRVLRLGVDGKLKDLWPDHGLLSGMTRGPDGAIWVITGSYAFDPVTHQPVSATPELWAIAPDGTRQKLHTFTPEEGNTVLDQATYGSLVYVGDRVLMTAGDAAYALDPVTYALTPLLKAADLGVAALQMDAAGNIFGLTSSQDLVLRKPDGTKSVIAHGLSASYDRSTWAVLAPDGSVYLDNFRDRQVAHLVNGTPTVVAGLGQTVASSVSDLVLKFPGALTVTPAGDLYVIDQVATFGFKLLHITPDKQVSTVAGTGVNGQSAGDDGPALQACFNHPSQVLTTHAGDVVVLDSGEVRRIDKRGTITSWLPPLAPGNPSLLDALAIALGSDDSLFALRQVPDVSLGFGAKQHFALSALAPGSSTIVDLADLGVTAGAYVMGADPAGSLYVAGEGKLQRFADGKTGLVTVVEDPQLTFTTMGGPNFYIENAHMAVDAQGRLYLTHTARGTIERYDPKKRAFEVIAGPGGSHFAGNGVDDGIKAPDEPVFDAAGNLVFSDGLHGQIKRILASDLP